MTSRHGTRSRYVQGCRCLECTAANRLYRREARGREHGQSHRYDYSRSEPAGALKVDRPAGPIGDLEAAVIEELEGLSASETRLGACAGALTLARIVDDPAEIRTHTRAVAALNEIMAGLRQASGQSGRRSRGRIASLHALPSRKPKRGVSNETP